ncbi:MAG: TRAP transporter small permease subunit [Hyphomonadaceae bacterium]|nr:TRAP transporter small permease subunit [Hyphomonadaceae bacterium]
MSEPAASPPRAPTLLERIAYAFGAVGLLGAMATDSIAVAGRRLQLPLLGSVEIVQAFVVIAASCAMLVATFAGEHASVRVLVDRAPKKMRELLTRAANLLFACFFAALAAGSVWIMWDLRAGAEATEIIGIPLAWLRGFWTVCAVIVAALLVKRALLPPAEKSR